MILDATQAHAEELPSGLVPAIVLITGDTNPANAVPRLSVGLIERDRLDGPVLVCDEFDCEIGNLLPDEILTEHASKTIALEGDSLTFI
jgi:hypothetical protein